MVGQAHELVDGHVLARLLEVAGQAAVAGLDTRTTEPGVLGFSRGDGFACIVNFSAVPHHDYKVGLPAAGRWEELLNTDAAAYGGSGVGNLGKVEALEADPREYARRMRAMRRTVVENDVSKWARRFLEEGSRVFVTGFDADEVSAAIDGLRALGILGLANFDPEGPMVHHHAPVGKRRVDGRGGSRVPLSGGGGTQRLPRLVGHGRALYLNLTGDPISGAQAYEWGLVEKAVPQSELLETALGVVRTLAQRSPHSMGVIKRLAAETRDLPLSEGMRREAQGFLECISSEDGAEGVMAFLEKREPSFTGR